MKIQSVRFGQFQWELISRMAARDQVSVSQYVRDASYARAVIDALQSREDAELLWAALTDALSEHPELLDRLEVLSPGTRPEGGQVGLIAPEDRPVSTDPGTRNEARPS
jgi:hypothetical protein